MIARVGLTPGDELAVEITNLKPSSVFIKEVALVQMVDNREAKLSFGWGNDFEETMSIVGKQIGAFTLYPIQQQSLQSVALHS